MLGGLSMDDGRWVHLKATAVRLIRKRAQHVVADFLEATPFELRAGMNSYNDDFSLLYYAAPVDDYVHLSGQAASYG